ncbi:unnamed protein product [Oikopleura dioica]|uniref:Uncharacterized protein n=1 Tax=Oikopleura dioica TaxID=34765 RepID=E4Y262_OIKDI|nr:unnamed protein product [Oikopleura dioica]
MDSGCGSVNAQWLTGSKGEGQRRIALTATERHQLLSTLRPSAKVAAPGPYLSGPEATKDHRGHRWHDSEFGQQIQSYGRNQGQPSVISKKIKERPEKDEIAVMSSDNELEVMHQIREVERALATHRVHSASSRETIKQTRANIDLACRVKEQLSGAVNNFRDVCRMMLDDVVKHQRGLTKSTVLSLFASFHSHSKVDLSPISFVRSAIHQLEKGFF